jgi:hypothetical protein
MLGFGFGFDGRCCTLRSLHSFVFVHIDILGNTSILSFSQDIVHILPFGVDAVIELSS